VDVGPNAAATRLSDWCAPCAVPSSTVLSRVDSVRRRDRRSLYDSTCLCFGQKEEINTHTEGGREGRVCLFDACSAFH
jgi:hypothetical protein